ncbi:hypothetical protein P175DRAFT_0557327 [Aspergillus ochraceoroseus IBT 24754]|uniref:Uncharacterized protein n=1 Tax=Aspergillus ochraceoroseus IBT 24754 TaxID=1392256 RepID=A0A2T5LWI4_9EURO|nr:uncharacterized protein P175DRAFT_0557327 [Aspergillus ochraceoroseus IBT 24754]PTU20644.1 hypothetical protein P175DRAFT_0557327 [Aspergillus ochraceoroseus IBT 24754]
MITQGQTRPGKTRQLEPVSLRMASSPVGLHLGPSGLLAQISNSASIPCKFKHGHTESNTHYMLKRAGSNGMEAIAISRNLPTRWLVVNPTVRLLDQPTRLTSHFGGFLYVIPSRKPPPRNLNGAVYESERYSVAGLVYGFGDLFAPGPGM